MMEISRSSQRILASLLEARTGQQLNLNRSWRIDSALSAIMREERFANMDQLVAQLIAERDRSVPTISIFQPCQRAFSSARPIASE